MAKRYCRNEEYHSTVVQKKKKSSYVSLRQEHIKSEEFLAVGGAVNAAGVLPVKK